MQGRSRRRRKSISSVILLLAATSTVSTESTRQQARNHYYPSTFVVANNRRGPASEHHQHLHHCSFCCCCSADPIIERGKFKQTPKTQVHSRRWIPNDSTYLRHVDLFWPLKRNGGFNGKGFYSSWSKRLTQRGHGRLSSRNMTRPISESDEGKVEEKNKSDDVEKQVPTGSSLSWWTRRKKSIVAIALPATYFSVMGAKCALPAVLSLLLSPTVGLRFPAAPASSPVTPQKMMARLLSSATVAIAIGKVVLGPCIDRCGGLMSLRIALTLLGVLMSIIAGCQSFSVFAASWILVDFVFSSCWAACVHALHQSFPPEEWATRIGALAASARAGNASAFALFSYILHLSQGRMRQAWRPVFAVAAALQLIPLGLLMISSSSTDKETSLVPDGMHDGTTEDSRRTEAGISSSSSSSLKASLMGLRKLAGTPAFWLHLVSRSVLMVFASFLLFVPTLMRQVYGASPSSAARVGSLYALGCLLAVTFGAQPYSRLRGKDKSLALVLMLVGATMTSIAQLGHVSGLWRLSGTGSGISMFFWGFTLAIPFYVPPSMYALSKGGKDSSATIADAFDVFGFALLAAFNGHVAGIEDQSIPSLWIPTFQTTSACSIISLMALALATTVFDGDADDVVVVAEQRKDQER